MFLRETYIPGARTTLAASALPDGRAYYQSKIKEFTTTDLTPDQIHAIGLAEGAAIRARMLDVIKEVGFTGDLGAYLVSLRSDPRFYAKTPQDLLDRAPGSARPSTARRGTGSDACRARALPFARCRLIRLRSIPPAEGVRASTS